MEIGSALRVPFAVTGWMAFWLHAVGVEMYIWLLALVVNGGPGWF